MNERRFIVITTIQPPTPSVDAFARLSGWTTVVVGDAKTPDDKWADRPDVKYLSLAEQRATFPTLAEELPLNHYARKNLGYLYAIEHGADLLGESDDDNTPNADWGRHDLPSTGPSLTVTGPKVANVYRHFSDSIIWPRGFPLELVLTNDTLAVEQRGEAAVWIMQSLVDGEPDVDAIYRLVAGQPANFRKADPIVLDAMVWAPFNSQNTIWRPPAFEFLYLPAHVTFRFTDILRGWVAQRLSWMLGGRLAFASPNAFQDRNEHDLLKDFESELPCYLETGLVLETLEQLPDQPDPAAALRDAYGALAAVNIVPEEELDLVDIWLGEVAAARESSAAHPGRSS